MQLAEYVPCHASGMQNVNTERQPEHSVRRARTALTRAFHRAVGDDQRVRRASRAGDEQLLELIDHQRRIGHFARCLSVRDRRLRVGAGHEHLRDTRTAAPTGFGHNAGRGRL